MRTKNLTTAVETGNHLVVPRSDAQTRTALPGYSNDVIAAVIEVLEPYCPTPPNTVGMSIQDALDAMVDSDVIEEWEAFEDAARAIQALAKDAQEAALADSLMRKLANRVAQLFTQELLLEQHVIEGARTVCEPEQSGISQILTRHHSRLTQTRPVIERVFIGKFRRGLHQRLTAATSRFGNDQYG